MSSLADHYAAALLELTDDGDRLEHARQTLMGCPELWSALTSPAVQGEEKQQVLSRLFDDPDEKTVNAFLQLLARKGRMELLPDIADSYQRLMLERGGGAICVMTCVHSPGAEEQMAIQNWLCARHKLNRVTMKIRLDPSLLGGFMLEIQGVTYDKSVRGGLEAMARQFRERGSR